MKIIITNVKQLPILDMNNDITKMMRKESEVFLKEGTTQTYLKQLRPAKNKK